MDNVSAPTAKCLLEQLQELERQDVDLSSVTWEGLEEGLVLKVDDQCGEPVEFLKITNE